MPEIERYLKLCMERRASDLHFSAGEPVRARIDGDLETLEPHPMDDNILQRILFEILTEAERKKFLSLKNLDKSYALEGRGYFRVNIFLTRRGLGAVLRTIPSKIPTMGELGLPEAVKTLSELGKGLVLVTGPTGSGKSTTLAAMINHINSNFPYHILTAEDPVEFVHTSKKSLVNQREIGSNCPSFADALKYALREDPDVILVGEMRDLETIGLALTAAETGHLVFGTLHTRGAGASVDRIIDSFPANQQAMIRTMLSESLAGVISQSLLKRADKSGRVAAYEILVVNHAISNLVREGKTFQIPSIMQTGRKEGMILMDQHILELVDKGMVAVEEAEAYMEDPTPLASRKGRAPMKPTAIQTTFNTTKDPAVKEVINAIKAPTTAPAMPASAPRTVPPPMAKPAPAPAPKPPAVPKAAPAIVAETTKLDHEIESEALEPELSAEEAMDDLELVPDELTDSNIRERGADEDTGDLNESGEIEIEPEMNDEAATDSLWEETEPTAAHVAPESDFNDLNETAIEDDGEESLMPAPAKVAPAPKKTLPPAAATTTPKAPPAAAPPKVAPGFVPKPMGTPAPLPGAKTAPAPTGKKLPSPPPPPPKKKVA
jgi:twitching motility protein PilT